MIELRYAECIASIILDDGDEELKGLRFVSLRTLYGITKKYVEEGFLLEIVEAFFMKKSQMVLEAETKSAMKAILKPSIPHYSGGKMVPENSPYYVEEEELMIWSRTTTRGPLISAGYERYMELFKKLLPEQAEKLSLDFQKETVEEKVPESAA